MESRRWKVRLIDGVGIAFVLAILCAIFFPVGIEPWRTGRPGKMTYCVTNLHSLAVALPMYNMDYGAYPETLAGDVKLRHGRVIPFDRTVGKGSLYPEYIKSVRAFHCKLSPVTDMNAVVEVRSGEGTDKFYAYDSYDVCCRERVDAENPVEVAPEAVRYTKSWAADRESVMHYPAYDMKDTAQLREYDYKRQLRSPKAGKDSIVTWCSYHNRPDIGSDIPVVFLDGHCDILPASEVEGTDGSGGARWREHPKL